MLIVISREAKKVFQTVFKRYESKYFTDSRQYAGVLDRLKIYPVSFSKYGTAYREGLVTAPKNIISGGDFCA